MPLSGSLWTLPLMLQSVPVWAEASARPSVTPSGRLSVLQSEFPWELASVPLSGTPWAMQLALQSAPMWVRPSVTPSGRQSVLQSALRWGLL